MNPKAGISLSRKTLRAILVICGVALISLTLRAAEPVPSPAETLHELRNFDTIGTVLHVGAHPDDENSQLIAYFSRGRGYRTAYLSVTRGDGGQNELGPEFDEKLGVIRTQELLAARRLDGGRQFFTRARDFGYSKTPEETLRFWGHDEVLGDVVRVIRTFRPDVIVTRFPIPPGSGGHGHHTASAMLAVEAFKLAADPKSYPEQIAEGLKPWQAKRVVWNGSGQGVPGALFNTDIGGTDPVTGEDFGAVATRSRSQHKTQGLGNGGFAFRLSTQTFTVLGGDPATKDLMDGVDTTWNRFPGGAEVAQLTDKAIAAFDTNKLSANVPALLAIRAQLATLAADPVVDEKRAQLDRILQQCLGLTVETTAAQPEVVPGESTSFHLMATVKGDIDVRWIEKRALLSKTGQTPGPVLASGQPTGANLKAGLSLTSDLAFTVPVNAPLTQPYWLREEGTVGRFRVDDPSLIGTAENGPSFPVEYVFEVGGQTLVVPDEPIATVHNSKGDRRRRIDVIPPVSLAFASGVSLFTPGSTRAVTVAITAARPNASGSLKLGVPDGWKISPASQNFRLAKIGDQSSLTFNVTAPEKPATGRITASADINGHTFTTGRIEINYPHVPFILLQPKAQARLVDVDFSTRGKTVGYLPGAGDATVEALDQLGYNVILLTGADLTPDKLKDLDAVVIGVRAFNERKDLAANLTNLFAYAANGGTVIAQYNRPGAGTQQMGPYPLSIQGSQAQAPVFRVTDETAPVTFLAPDNPALTTPNKISSADFDGWFQERGAYFPNTWDREHYTAVLAMSDPGEAPLQGSLLIAKVGKGYYVYTGLAFFRQLPQGIPGAYRLFANLVSLGK